MSGIVIAVVQLLADLLVGGRRHLACDGGSDGEGG